MDIRLAFLARQEVNEAADYYEASRPGLGTEFTDEFDVVYERIKLHPHAGTRFRKNYRLQILSRFPYTVYYSVNEDEIVIFAVAHQHRKPGYWKRRMQSHSNNKINEPPPFWPATFDEVEDAQLLDMLKATPAQRLAMVDELLQFVTLARAVNKTDN